MINAFGRAVSDEDVALCVQVAGLRYAADEVSMFWVVFAETVLDGLIAVSDCERADLQRHLGRLEMLAEVVDPGMLRILGAIEAEA